MSRSSPRRGKCGDPSSDPAGTGRGRGFACANRRKSCARSRGRTTRLACTFPGARPEVGPVNAPVRMRRRSADPAFPNPSTIAFMRHPPALDDPRYQIFGGDREAPLPPPPRHSGGGGGAPPPPPPPAGGGGGGGGEPLLTLLDHPGRGTSD